MLNNLHTKQKWNEKKAFYQVRKKIKFKWDEFQTQAQQMQEVQHPWLVCLTSDMLSGIIGILAWGWGSSHKVHGVARRKMTTLLKQFQQA